MDEPAWLLWARELQAIAQTGLTFSTDAYDLERYRRVRAIAAAMLADGSGTALERIAGLFEQDLGYPTPKVDVRGAVFRDGRILMVREVSDGGWTLPGGWADVDQSAKECVEREIREESGFEARAVKLAAVYDYRRQGHRRSHPYSIYKLFFLCELCGGQARCSLETSAVDFFAPDGLPPLSLGRITPTQIARMFVHHNDASLATEFD
ncbi:MAG TPA: NUDIX hydrolase [Steroidobacteraceae bacterium]|nr:NUDIX hydrolase [Steroidobacteraceae bacterium]